MKSGALSDFEPILLWGEACYVTRRLLGNVRDGNDGVQLVER